MSIFGSLVGTVEARSAPIAGIREATRSRSATRSAQSGCTANAKSLGSSGGWARKGYCVLECATVEGLVNRASYSSWLAFLNTVRTKRFDQVLALRPLLATFAKAA